MRKKTSHLIFAMAVFIAGMAGANYFAGRLTDEAASQNVISSATQGNKESAPRHGYGAAMLNKPRPAFSLPDLDGKLRHIDEWNGEVLVINFWATWCPPCRKEIPAFNRLQKKYASRDVQFLGIALDTVEAINRFVTSIPIDYPVMVSESAGIGVAQAYGNHDGVLPYTVFINREGVITSVASGGLTETVTESTLAQLL